MTRIHLATGFRSRRILAASSLLVVFACSSARAGLLQELQKAVGRLPHPQAQAGACVIDLTTGQTVFTLDADRPLTPASTMKLFAMSTALAELGPEFAFETVLATDGRNLLVIGDGDPGFGDEKIHRARGESPAATFEAWADELRRRGLTSVPGDIIIDEWVFADEPLHPTWDKDDLGKWYAAPVGALNINDNCLDITVTPAGRAGAPVQVTVQPENSLLKFINNCRSGDKGTPSLHHRPGTSDYTISGRAPKRWSFGPVAVSDPGLLFADSLRTVLARKG
ncbi:MAG: D-alanyl-D-alanine carboxypeptidase, partial [Phycisphaerales bacterium]|nr:D-alanyl-D-alanine carboxypeptidase [Phycisphaerales bacterium]